MSQKESDLAKPHNSFLLIMPPQVNSQSNASSELKSYEITTQNINTTEKVINTSKTPSSSVNTTASLEDKSNAHAPLIQPQETLPNNSSFVGMNSENLGLIFKNSIDEMNKKREKDSTVTSEFHACITEWANESTNKIIEALFKKFQDNSIQMSSKLELIQKDLESISKLEDELLLISNQVEMLFREIKQNS